MPALLLLLTLQLGHVGPESVRPGPPWSHRAWTIEEGLPQNTVTALAQTPDGYLWIGTVKGIARFDGFHFAGYEAANSEGLVDDRISTLFVDSRGTLWIGTESGIVSRYRSQRFDELSAGGVVKPAYIRAIAEDARGRIWIGGTSGVHLVVGDSIEYVPLEKDGRTYAVTALHRDRNDLWIGSGGGLALVTDDGPQWTDLGRDLKNTTVYDIASGKEGLWLATSEGLARYADGRVQLIAREHGAAQYLLEDGRGILWLGSIGRGLRYLRQDALSNEGLPEALKDAYVRQIFQDRSGLIWVAAGDKGLHVLREPLFHSYTIDENRSDFSVMRVAEDASGDVWTATLESGVFRVSKGQFQRYTQADGLSGRAVLSLASSSEGDLWAAANAMPKRFQARRFQAIPELSKINVEGHPRVVGLAARREGGIWIAQRGQVVFHDASGFSAPVPVPEIHDRDFIEMKDLDGVLWLFPGLGVLCRVEGSRKNCLDESQGIPHAYIRDVFAGPDGSYWLGTYGSGLCRLEETRVTCLSTGNGLPDNTVHTIIEDRFGYVWLSSNKGVSRIRKDLIEAAFEDPAVPLMPDTYGRFDGMPSRECNLGAILARDGTIWYPTMNGLAQVDPSRAGTYEAPILGTFVENVLVDGVLNEGGGPLPAGSDRIEFRFTAIQFGDAEHVGFRARLLGHESEWVPLGTSRTVTYTNLSSGDYVFEVQSRLGSLDWGAPSTYAMSIAPYFYQTWWFRIIFFLAASAGLMAVYRARVGRLIERERLSKSEAEAKRLAELDAAKSRFFANITHEFRTPLTLIIAPSEEALERGDINAIERRRAELVVGNARRLLGLIDKLLDLSRLDAGKMEISASDAELVSFVRSLVSHFQPLAERRKVTLQFRCDLEDRPSRFDADKVISVLGNLLSNALKYTPEGGKVWVTLSETGPAGVELVVKDTGPGIPKDQLQNVFERYERGVEDAETGAIGSGIGLALAKELVDLLGGVLLVESEVGFGSAFIVRMPLPRAASRLPTDGAAKLWSRLPDVLEPGSRESFGAPEAHGERSNRALVLLVEDNEEVRSLVEAQLSVDFDVMTAGTGEDAIEFAREHAPDVVVTDVMMPGMSGLELCRRIREDSDLWDTPVVMLTAKVGHEHEIAALGVGADDYVAKPYHAETLRQKLKAHINVRQSLREKYRRDLIVPTTGVRVAPEQEEFARKVFEVTVRRMGDHSFTVEELASEIGLSRRQFARRVKAVLGESPSNLIHRLRLERAGQLLVDRVGTVSEIAYSVGFRSVSHFGAAFKEAYGHTPGEHIADGT